MSELFLDVYRKSQFKSIDQRHNRDDILHITLILNKKVESMIAGGHSTYFCRSLYTFLSRKFTKNYVR